MDSKKLCQKGFTGPGEQAESGTAMAKDNLILGCVSRNVTGRSRGMTSTLCLALVRPYPGHQVLFGVPHHKKGINKEEQAQ